MFNSLYKSAITFIAATGVLMVPALAGPSFGIFQSENKSADYDIHLCGPNDQALCATFVAVHGAEAEKAKALTGETLIDQAAPDGPNRWKGKIRLGESELDVTMVVTPGEKVVSTTCMFLICTDATMLRIR